MPSPSDIAFTPAVKTEQERRGSRAAYARMEAKGGWATTVTPELAAFIAETGSFYLATASKDGQPYVQHRGGPKGFLHVIDETTLAFADFTGNRQYITAGNLAENARVCLLLMDYANRRRVKVWGTARVVGDDAELMRRLFPAGYRARPEQAIVVKVTAWDANCPQHIPQMFSAEDVEEAVAALKRRIEALEQENAALRNSRATADTAVLGDPR
jgi:predicted pyridoxine 5'-phosphate oxidase superfamily flavin-nucleotide-binding protein